MRKQGNYWVYGNKCFPDHKSWQIYYWDGDIFWSDGDDFSEDTFEEIDEVMITRHEVKDIHNTTSRTCKKSEEEELFDMEQQLGIPYKDRSYNKWNVGSHYALHVGQKVYHRDVYNHKEPLEVVGVREEEVELEGDFSGGIHNVLQRAWMPIKGVSTIYDHKYKEECRQTAVAIEALAAPITDRKQDAMTETMFDLLDMVLQLTTDVSMNPEFK